MHDIEAVCQTTANVNELTRQNDLHSLIFRTFYLPNLDNMTLFYKKQANKQFTYILKIISQMLMHLRNSQINNITIWARYTS